MKMKKIDIGEPILKSNDRKLDGGDDIILDGNLGALQKMGIDDSNVVLMKDEGAYKTGTPLIRLNASYENSSQGYNTNTISRDESLTLNAFPRGEGDLLTYESKSGTFSDGSQIILLKRIGLSEPTHFAANQTIGLHQFPQHIGAISNSKELQADSGIYRENDTDAVGPDTFGDRLTAVTVTNTGTLANQHIDRITLQTQSTTIATASDPTANGTWVLQPTGSAAEFGPETGTEFTLRTTIAADAPGGETVSLRVPAVRDADADGAFDPGDTGLFFAQDNPSGDLGPGPTLTVETAAGSTSEADATPPVALDLRPTVSNQSAANAVVSVAVTGNDSNRAVRASLLHATNDTTVTTQTGQLGPDGTTEFAFDALPGRYRVSVEAAEGAGTALSKAFRIEPAQNLTLSAPDEPVALGEAAPFNLSFTRAGAATIRLEDSAGELIESVRIESEAPSQAHPLAVDTAGGAPATAGEGFELQAGPDGSAPIWVGAANADGSNASSAPGPPNSRSGGGPAGTTGPPAHARTAIGSQSLGVGEYTLAVRRAGKTVDTATVEVAANWSASVETFVAPRSASLDSAAAVAANTSARDRIAVGDRLVIAVNTTGLGPYARNITPGRSRGHGRGAEARADSAGNSQARNRTEYRSDTAGPPAFVSVGPKSGPQSSSLGSDFERVETDEPGQFYLVANASTGAELRPGRGLETDLVLTEASPFVPESDSNETTREAYGTELGVVEARAELSSATPNGTLDLPPVAAVHINGTTTVAPGTTATVHVDANQTNETLAVSTTVTENGTYETTANLSEFESGTNYTVSVTANDDRISDVHTGQFVGAETATYGAAGGGTGGGQAGADDGSGPTDPASTTAAPDDSPMGELPEIPDRPVERVLEEVPEPLRLGTTALLIIGLGGLALIVVGVGVKRLLRP